jgi:hypothetical protein
MKTTKAVLQSWFRSLPAGDAKVNGFSADRILAKDKPHIRGIAKILYPATLF